MTRPSHMFVRQAAWEQNEVTGGISLVSPFSLTSCPVAAVYCCCCLAIKHVWQGDIQVSKAWGGENGSVQLRNFANSSSSASLQQKTGQCGVFFYMFKKGSPTVLFLFSQVSSCISASHLRFQPSHMIVCLVKAYEHCHLVVICKAPNDTNLHLRKGHYVHMVASEGVFFILFKLAGVSKQVNVICRCTCVST